MHPSFQMIWGASRLHGTDYLVIFQICHMLLIGVALGTFFHTFHYVQMCLDRPMVLLPRNDTGVPQTVQGVEHVLGSLGSK